MSKISKNIAQIYRHYLYHALEIPKDIVDPVRGSKINELIIMDKKDDVQKHKSVWIIYNCKSRFTAILLQQEFAIARR